MNKGLLYQAIFLSIVVLTSVSLLGQTRTGHTDLGSDKGFYEYTSVSGSHDASAGWSSEVNGAVGYDFTRSFAAEMGLPFYLLTTTNRVTSTGTATDSTHYSSLGDAFLAMKFSPELKVLKYRTALTATAPTGDTANGISTGRATCNWNNHFDRDVWKLDPFVEVGVGNTLPSTARYKRAYTTLGFVSEIRVGNSFDLGKTFSAEASFYDDIASGNQKVYSHYVVLPVPTQGHGKLASVSSGGAILAADHGFTGALSASAGGRWEFEIAYNRSLPNALNTISVTTGYRLGHVAKPSSSK